MSTSPRTARVFIVNKAGHDFSSAERFGELIPVTTGNMNVFRPDRPLFQIQEVLGDFDPETDYLLLTGNVFANVLAVSSILAARFSKSLAQLRFLVYDAKNQRYLQHTLTQNNKGELFFKRSKERP